MTPEERRNELRRRQLAARVRSAQEPKPRTFGQTLKENLLGDNDPTTQNFGERVGSVLNKAGEAMTLGLIGDEASAAVESLAPGVDYEDRRDHYRQQEEILEQERPGLSLAADIGGGLAMPLGALGALRNAGPLAQMLGSGALTGAMSGTYGFMEGEGGVQSRLEDGATDTAIGAGIGAAIPVVGGAVKKGADAVMRGRAIREAARGAPGTDELRRMGRALYRQVDDAGVSIKPSSVRAQMDDISSSLADEGARYTGAERVLPSSVAVMEAAQDVGKGANSIPFREMDIFRRYVGSAAGKDLANKADTRAVTRAAASLDDFIQGLGPADIDAGDIDALQTALPKAKSIWARMSRSQILDDAIENAADYRTGEASGLRAQFQRILKSDKLNRAFSDAERAVMRRVVNGTIPEQMLNYAGSGLGMMGQVALGGLTGSWPGAIAGAATAAGSRKMSAAMVRRNAELARRIIAKGGLKAFPQLSPARRRLIEQLMRQTGVATQQ